MEQNPSTDTTTQTTEPNLVTETTQEMVIENGLTEKTDYLLLQLAFDAITAGIIKFEPKVKEETIVELKSAIHYGLTLQTRPFALSQEARQLLVNLLVILTKLLNDLALKNHGLLPLQEVTKDDNTIADATIDVSSLVIEEAT